MQGKHGKYGSEWKHGKKKCSRERVEKCGEVRWRRDLGRACSTGFWEGKCRTKRKVREIEESSGGKESTGIVDRDTSKATMLAGK